MDVKKHAKNCASALGESNDNSLESEKVDWVELFDEESKRVYWWHPTKGSTWEKPPEASAKSVFQSAHLTEASTTLSGPPNTNLGAIEVTKEWLNRHAAYVERVKNQELWVKATALEEQILAFKQTKEDVAAATLKLEEEHGDTEVASPNTT